MPEPRVLPLIPDGWKITILRDSYSILRDLAMWRNLRRRRARARTTRLWATIGTRPFANALSLAIAEVGRVELVVREVANGRVARVGLKFR